MLRKDENRKRDSCFKPPDWTHSWGGIFSESHCSACPLTGETLNEEGCGCALGSQHRTLCFNQNCLPDCRPGDQLFIPSTWPGGTGSHLNLATKPGAPHWAEMQGILRRVDQGQEPQSNKFEPKASWCLRGKRLCLSNILGHLQLTLDVPVFSPRIRSSVGNSRLFIKHSLSKD